MSEQLLLPFDGPCRRSSFVGEMIGAACPDCGHTNLVHSGKHNPALNACALCELQA